MTDNPWLNTLLILLLVLIVWLVLGRALNRRRATAIVRALQGAMTEIGGGATWRFRPNLGVEITVAEPRPPYSSVKLHIILEPREVLPLWLFERLIRHNTDHLILEAQLVKRAETELLLADPTTRLGRLALEQARRRGVRFETLRTKNNTILLRWVQGNAKPLADFIRLGLQPDLPLWVLATQHQKSPQLLMICGIRRLDREEMYQVFRRLRDLAHGVTK